MIRTIVSAWITGAGLVFGAAALTQGPNSTAQSSTSTVEPPPAAMATPAATAAADPPPAPVPPPVIQPVAPPAPVTVQFDGVSPSQIVGDRVNLNLATGGSIKSYTWMVMPPGTIGLKVFDGGAKADFTSRFPGTYVFLVAVAGSDGSVAQAYHTLELRADSPAPGPIPAAAAVVAQPKPPASDPSSLVQQWAADVKSRNRRAEQLQIASGFRQAAGAIDGGMFAGGDLFAQTKAMCSLSLGGNLGPWTPWFGKVEQLFHEFERLKVLTTPANYSAANKNVARALETMSDE